MSFADTVVRIRALLVVLSFDCISPFLFVLLTCMLYLYDACFRAAFYA